MLSDSDLMEADFNFQLMRDLFLEATNAWVEFIDFFSENNRTKKYDKGRLMPG
jgi:hypothetical protein